LVGGSGAAASTVERELDLMPHTPPDFVVGLDGKRQPARKNGNRAGA
jgi:hypothetical protein